MTAPEDRRDRELRELRRQRDELREELARHVAYAGAAIARADAAEARAAAAALSVAPQPQPDLVDAQFWAYRCGECRSASTCDAQRSCLDGLSPIDPPPASEDRPVDLMSALRASVEAAKKRRSGSGSS